MQIKNRFFSWINDFSPQAETGQVLLIVVLVMVVALTVGISVATRSITNVRTTSEEDSSQRAFSAAEAGIERVIKDINSSGINGVPLNNNANIKNVTITKLNRSDSTRLLLNSVDKDAQAVVKDQGVDVFFVGRNTDGSLNTSTGWPTTGTADITVQWDAQGAGDCNAAAMEMIFLIKNGSGVDTVHQVFDACTTRGNNFTGLNSIFTTRALPSAFTSSNDSLALHYQVVLTGRSNLLLGHFTPLYAPSIIAISSTAGLPDQGAKISSTGESGQTFRKIEVNNSFAQVPTELYSVLFAPAGQ